MYVTGQGLPGPSSTQLVISTASTHGGAISGVIALIFWALPGFTVLTLSGMFLYNFIDKANPPIWLLGIPPAAMSLIFKASFKFVQKLDKFGIGIGMVSKEIVFLWSPNDQLLFSFKFSSLRLCSINVSFFQFYPSTPKIGSMCCCCHDRW